MWNCLGGTENREFPRQLKLTHPTSDEMKGATKKKALIIDQGPKSLIAVITLRRLLREEKQGATARTVTQFQLYH